METSKGIDDLPAEVLHCIFKKLDDFESVAALRLQGTRYAEIGSEYLASRIRFYTAEDSLQRLQNLINIPGVAKNIDTINYEGNLLGHRSLRTFRLHFKQVHHVHEAPAHPGEYATKREMRLYQRNMNKYEKKIHDDYLKHDASYKKQRSAFQSELMQDALAALTNLPKLRHVNLSTGTSCAHSLSKRYQEAFDLTCRMPIELCSRPSIGQLRSLVIPDGSPLRGLRSLSVHALSPRFFTKMSHQQSIIDVFESLKTIRIVFRLEEEQRLQVETTDPSIAYGVLNKSYLREALAVAQGAEVILVNFDDLGYYGSATELKTIVGDTVWPHLKILDLDCIKFGADDLIRAYKRQPALKNVLLAFAYCVDRSWSVLLKKIKQKLSLATFQVTGLLEDTHNLHSTNSIDACAYEEEHVEISMGQVIDDFVTGNIFDDDEEFDPFYAFDWQDPEELYDKYGWPDESDSDIDMSDSDVEMSEALSNAAALGENRDASVETGNDVPSPDPMEF